MSEEEIFGIEELKNKAQAIQKENALCQECYDTGRITQKDGTRVFCNCYREKIWNHRFREYGIPELYFEYDLRAWDNHKDGNSHDLSPKQIKRKQDIQKFVAKYIKCLRLLCGSPVQKMMLQKANETIRFSSLKLHGDNGSGKTMLASIIAMEAARQGLVVKYYEWAELASILSDFDNNEEHKEIAEEFRNKHLIVVDNICNISFANKCLKLQLDRLAQSRVKSGRPIILTFSGEYTEAEPHSAWCGLIESCFSLDLPTAPRN